MSSSTQRSPLPLFTTLSVMMFFLFFTWGSWFAGLGRFMFEAGFSGKAIGDAYSCTPIAAIVTPFFIGIFADRFMNAEKLQGLLMIIGGIFIAAAPSFADPENPGIFIGLLLAHALCFMPTLGLSNTICLKHLSDAERDYPRVRIFATLGWILAGLAISFVFKYDTSVNQCYVAAIAAFVIGIYSFFLPKTPPPARGQKVSFGDLVGTGTLPYFKKFSFAVFMFASLLVCCAFMPYWVNLGSFLGQAGMEKTTAFLTWGQIAELPVLFFVLPIFLKKFGIKWTMIVGILCWVIRYFVFAAVAGSLGDDAVIQGSLLWLAAFGVLLHGFSYDFVFVSGYLYVDRHVHENVRAQAQGLLTVFTQGIAFLISSQVLCGYYYTKVIGEEATFPEWKQFWMAPVAYLVVILIAFAVLFREKKPIEHKTPAES